MTLEKGQAVYGYKDKAELWAQICGKKDTEKTQTPTANENLFFMHDYLCGSNCHKCRKKGADKGTKCEGGSGGGCRTGGLSAGGLSDTGGDKETGDSKGTGSTDG